MGEYAEMILNGECCQVCMVPCAGEPRGYPFTCGSCQLEDRIVSGKTHCPTCGKRVKAKGLNQHRRDAHNEDL